MSAVYLGNDSLSCAIAFEEEVVSLYEELARVFLFTSCPLLPQNHRANGVLLIMGTFHLLYKKKKGYLAIRKKTLLNTNQEIYIVLNYTQ